MSQIAVWAKLLKPDFLKTIYKGFLFHSEQSWCPYNGIKCPRNSLPQGLCIAYAPARNIFPPNVHLAQFPHFFHVFAQIVSFAPLLQNSSSLPYSTLLFSKGGVTRWICLPLEYKLHVQTISITFVTYLFHSRHSRNICGMDIEWIMSHVVCLYIVSTLNKCVLNELMSELGPKWVLKIKCLRN